MPKLEEQVLHNAEIIRGMYARISETAAQRSRSAAHMREWKEACATFHAGFDALSFPGGSAAWIELCARDATQADNAIAFVGADPWFFRSGYMKKVVWRCLKRIPLNKSQERSLEAVALAWAGEARRRCNFWDMVRCMRFRNSSRFWTHVAKMADAAPHHRDGIKPRWMLLAYHNHPVETWVSRELHLVRQRPDYTPDWCFPDITLDSKIKEPR